METFFSRKQSLALDRLTRFGRQIEDQNAEEGDEQGGQDEVDGVEERFAADGNVESDVRFGRSRRLAVVVHVEGGRGLDNVPRATLPVVGQVDVPGPPETKAHLVPVERPTAELHHTLLLVKRKVSHVDGARRLVDGRRDPLNAAVREDEDVALVANFVVAIGTGKECVIRKAIASSATNLLIEKNQVGLPDFVGRKSQHGNAAVIRLVPSKLVIFPFLNGKLIRLSFDRS